MRSTPVLLVSAVLATGAAVFVLAQQNGADPSPPNAPDQKPAFAGQTRAPARSDVAFDVVTVAEGLRTRGRWRFFPNGKMLVTERPGPAASGHGRRQDVGARRRAARGGRARSGRAARRRARPGVRDERA